MAAMQRNWDIFCRVIDNFGDIGVCWRLARQLANEHGRQVRLWVDDLGSLQLICPEIAKDRHTQMIQGVAVHRWEASTVVDRVVDVVVEAFACDLPSAYLQAMADAKAKPRWINLEYLTAEPWAESCHGMASPHPTLPLIKYFFFPGFSPPTGGLLREGGLPLPDIKQSADLEISLFCYETAPVSELLGALASSPIPVRCYVPPGKPLAAVTFHLGGAGPWRLGNARIEPIAFLALDDYDALLRRCGINFVRGEDSFVRAQWAGHPFIWQVYRQEEDAHLVKLEAFLDRYCVDAPSATANAIRGLFRAWNTGNGLVPAWQVFLALRDEISRHNQRWRDNLCRMPDMATALINFCAAKV